MKLFVTKSCFVTSVTYLLASATEELTLECSGIGFLASALRRDIIFETGIEIVQSIISDDDQDTRRYKLTVHASSFKC